MTDDPKDPAELSDEDHEAYGAMMHTMRPRDEPKETPPAPEETPKCDHT